TIGLQQGGEGQQAGFHGLFATRLRTVGRRQGVLERGIQQLMASLAQKHKEFSRFACACSNFLFFRGQRNRWVPHDRLLQVGGARSSSTYQSTEPPTVSTPSELLSKQLISVLGGVLASEGSPAHGAIAVRASGESKTHQQYAARDESVRGA